MTHSHVRACLYGDQVVSLDNKHGGGDESHWLYACAFAGSI